MCLNVVIGTGTAETPERCWGVFRYTGGVVEPLYQCHSTENDGCYEIGKWYKCKEINLPKYVGGFHRFTSKKGAITYRQGFCNNVVCKCEGRGKFTLGSIRYCRPLRVKVYEEMRILSINE